ncbi:hypothetical protein ACFQWF_24270 [Methylorubrum suomiense]
MQGRGALGLSPLRDLRALSAGDWIATGPDPALALGPAAAVAALSGRTVRIRCRPEGASPVLVVEAEGMEARRYRLTPHAAEPGTDDLIRLPAATRALQIEPGSERFRLDAVAVEPVGRAAAGLFRARKIVERLPAQERRPLRLLRRALGLLRTVPPGEILRRLTRAAATAAPPALYADWIAAVEVPSLPSAETMRRLVEALPDRPTFSVLMAAGAGDEARVGASLAGLQAQIYPDWELCLATQAPFPSVDEPRLRPCIPDGPGEAAALQACLAAARGTHIAVLEPGAVLAPPRCWPSPAGSPPSPISTASTPTRIGSAPTVPAPIRISSRIGRPRRWRPASISAAPPSIGLTECGRWAVSAPNARAPSITISPYASPRTVPASAISHRCSATAPRVRLSTTRRPSGRWRRGWPAPAGRAKRAASPREATPCAGRCRSARWSRS